MNSIVGIIRRWIRRSPALYFTLCGNRPAVKRLRARRDSELVVEAFPRSANTSSMYALFFAQGGDLRVGHHLHVPAHIKYAVIHHIPCLVIMREPLDCVASLMVMRKGGDPRDYLLDYIDFAKVAYEERTNLVVEKFDVIVTNGMGGAVRSLNDRFGTEFREPTNSREEKAWVERKIREWNREYSGGDPEKLSIPTEAKRKRAEEMRARVMKEPHLLLRARDLYHNLIS